ncbi:MAG: NHLP leader peptide family RiPP precursor [Cyanobacteria bacterium J06649_11]
MIISTQSKVVSRHPEVASRQDVESFIIAKAMEDKDFRQALLADPKSVMEKELSIIAGKEIHLPEEFEVKIVEEKPNVAYLTLPSLPAEEAHNFSGAELDPDGGLPFYCTTITCKPGFSC